MNSMERTKGHERLKKRQLISSFADPFSWPKIDKCFHVKQNIKNLKRISMVLWGGDNLYS